MLSIPPSNRVAIGTVQVAGKTYEVFASLEWARYFQALTTQTNENAAGLNATQPFAAFLGDTGEAPDVFPGPPGQAGLQGDPGLALFMLQESADEQPMLVPPVVDGAFVPTAAKDAASGVPGLTLFKLNLKNAAGTIISWFTTAATAARTWTMPDKDGTVAMTSDFASPPAIGSTSAAAGSFTSLTASAGFGCNGKAAQTAATLNGPATDLASVIALCNQQRAALIANGIAA
jgi:hypothetical protein